MEDLNSLRIAELRGKAEAAGIEGFKTMTKAQLMTALQPDPQGPPKDTPKVPNVEGKTFEFRGGRYVLVETPTVNPVSRRYFDQKGTLYTDESHRAPLTRAYNLEHTLPITDMEEQVGAKERGQSLGDASGGIHLKDNPAEHE